MPSFTLETRAFQEGDEALLLEGIERARAAAGGGARRNLEELRWRYGRAPAGACLGLARDATGRVVAGIAATRQRARLQGEEAFFLEVGDLFSDFSAGAGLSRAGALLALGEAFAAAFGGMAPASHPVMYGLPDRRAHRLGLARLGWEVLRSENELFLELRRAPALDAGGLAVEPIERFPATVQSAFEGHAAGRRAILVKDAAALDWRYVDRPGAPYERALAGPPAKPRGYVVLRAGLVHDWCARPDDEEAQSALLAWALERVRQRGGTELALVVSDTAPEWRLFQRRGFRVRGTAEYLCFRSFQRPAIMSWLFQNWSYTRGDTLR